MMKSSGNLKSPIVEPESGKKRGNGREMEKSGGRERKRKGKQENARTK